MIEESVLALQRTLVEAALMADPGPLEREPAGFAAARGLGAGDQAAFERFRDRLQVYRRMVRGDLAEPVETICFVTRALLEQAGAWETCLGDFLESRTARSMLYRDLAATFLGWLAATGWGAGRWPFLLQLVHFEVLHALVAHHPGGPGPPGLHPGPRPEDRLVLDAPTQLVTYSYQVHLSTVDAPVPAAGTTHLLAYRDGEGQPRWMELTPATAALVLNAQRAPIGGTLLDLGLDDRAQALELLADFQRKGAILGFAMIP